MIRVTTTLFTLLLAFSLSDAYAETYTWTDDQGTIHFAEDLGQVPAKSRKKARIVEDIESPRDGKPASQPQPAADRGATPQAVPSGRDGKPAPVELYGGKTSSWWENDFRDREAAMTAVRKRIVEITDLLKNQAATKDELDKLVAEYTSLLAQFNEMKAQYHQQVENARKAGFQVTIQQ